MNFYGFNHRLNLGPYIPDLHIDLGRVNSVHGSQITILTAHGERPVRTLRGIAEEPAVGDWVRWQSIPQDLVGVTLTEMLPRFSCLRRQAAGKATVQQTMVANVDWLFLATSMNQDFNLSRMERYLTLAWDSGATPIVLLTKADLVPDPAAYIEALLPITQGVAVHPVSAENGVGLEALRPYFGSDATIAILGSSGVGKTTLLNALSQKTAGLTGEIRIQDDRGRHTTTQRQLHLLSDGTVFIDTPGMRALKLWVDSNSLADSFADIAQLASTCRFRDCQHDQEPGCVVNRAIAEGLLSERRLANYQKLRKEQAYHERVTGGSPCNQQREYNRARTKQYKAIQRMKRKP